VKKLLTAAATSIAALALSVSGVAAGGPPKANAIYVDNVAYRTVGTPTDFSNTGAPAHSFDTIYLLDDGTNPAAKGFASVATAAPGDKDYNGGRWMVFDITWINSPTQLTNAQAVLDAAAAGDLSISAHPIKYFECPVIPMRGNSGH
jgi:hypothetical protein